MDAFEGATRIQYEIRLQKLVTVYVITGLLFLLLPGTFLGVWNLISISEGHRVESISPAWIQAHGHSQVFGWLGSFVLGIGFYSLSKMGRLAAFAVGRGWVCFALWTSGLALRWTANVTGWQWRMMLPVSAILQIAAFLIFYATVWRHQSSPERAPRKREPWMVLVAASSIGFLVTLAADLGACIFVVLLADSPAYPHALDQRLLVLPIWGFLVPAVWGFNARWLPTFLGLRAPDSKLLYLALAAAWAAVAATLIGFAQLAAALLPVAVTASIVALGVFEASKQSPKTAGVHPSFSIFVRGAYAWLLTGSVLSMWAVSSDRAGGIWGASRHALTVGFLSTMVFAIGPRILPAFCGAPALFSTHLMFGALLLLNIGCALRVAAEIPAYEGWLQQAWPALPVSALLELAAVTLFAINLFLTFSRPAAHVMRRA